MDETPRQLIGQTRQPIKAAPRRAASEDYEYERLGTCNVFMACQSQAGRRITAVAERRTKTDWAHFVKAIAQAWPTAQCITLVMDNLNTHGAGSLCEAFPPEEGEALRDRFEFVYTSRHGSWLNMPVGAYNDWLSADAADRVSYMQQYPAYRLVTEAAHWFEQRSPIDRLSPGGLGLFATCQNSRTRPEMLLSRLR